MPVSHNHRIIFVHIPRTAGTTIEKALGICGIDNQGSNILGRKLLFGFDGHNFQQHLLATEIRSRLGEDMFGSYFKFAFVRNPFARLVSAYFNHYHQFETFDRFITTTVPKEMRLRLRKDQARHLKLQSDFVLDDAGRIIVDFIGFQEHLADDTQTIIAKTGARCPIPAKHEIRSLDYQNEFSERNRRLAESYYERDLALFGYTFDAGPSPSVRESINSSSSINCNVHS